MTTAEIERKATKRRSLAEMLSVGFDPHAEWLRNKREDAALTLTSLLNEAGMSRADLSRKLSWKPSRVTCALSGNANLTINTMAEIIGATGFDFDILVRPRSSCRAFQPWEQVSISSELLELHAQLVDTLDEAKENCHRSKIVLSTASSISRALFRKAAELKAAPAISQSFTYEEDYATVACAA